MAPTDYRKWDHIACSSDEDEDETADYVEVDEDEDALELMRLRAELAEKKKAAQQRHPQLQQPDMRLPVLVIECQK